MKRPIHSERCNRYDEASCCDTCWEFFHSPPRLSSRNGTSSSRSNGKPGACNKPDGIMVTPVLVCLSDVTPCPVEWLWPGRIALGKLSLIAGDPGLGKSFVSLFMAATVSRGGYWPDALTSKVSPGGVVLLSAEDDVADTIRPRLDAAGADASCIVAIQAVRRAFNENPEKDCTFSLDTDMPALEAAIKSVRNCKLVIIDPVTAYLGETDSHKNAEIRGLLSALAALAAKYRIAIVCVTHLNKSANGPAIYRAIGSIAFAAAARSVWAVVKDKENPARRLMLPTKNNLGLDMLGLAYTIQVSGTGGAPKVVWEPDPVDISADDAMHVDGDRQEDSRSDANQAEAWLRVALKDGPVPSNDVLAQGRANGFTNKMLRKALEAIGGVAQKGSFSGGWYWTMTPTSADHSPTGESSESSQKHEESSANPTPQKSEDFQDAQDSKASSDDTKWEILE